MALVASATSGDVAVAAVIMIGLVIITAIICFTVLAYMDKHP